MKNRDQEIAFLHSHRKEVNAWFGQKVILSSENICPKDVKRESELMNE